MMKIRLFEKKDFGRLSDFTGRSEWPTVGDREMKLHDPDGHLVAFGNGTVQARASLWWRGNGLKEPGVGRIGHFAAADGESAVLLLEEAAGVLVGKGCRRAVGPMDGCTWFSYRLCTGLLENPPFFLEPGNPVIYPELFTTAGFRPMLTYGSYLVEDLEISDSRLDPVRRRFGARGLVLRPFQTERSAEDLESIFELCCIAFRRNPFYADVSLEKFLELYRPLIPLIRPEMFPIAELDGRTVGFAFAVPDLLDGRKQRVVFKTAAVLPGREFAGLGSILAEEIHRSARSQGFSQAIHALQSEENGVRNITRRFGARKIREYTLFSRNLEGPAA